MKFTPLLHRLHTPSNRMTGRESVAKSSTTVAAEVEAVGWAGVVEAEELAVAEGARARREGMRWRGEAARRALCALIGCAKRLGRELGLRDATLNPAVRSAPELACYARGMVPEAMH